jgi:hypothetical protein
MDVSALPIPLKRTGSAIDRLIALPIEAVGDWVEKKLKSNLDAHVEAVRNSRGRRGKKAEISEEDLSVERLRSIHEWAERAREVDSCDKVLSAAWRAALDRLLEEDDQGAELLRTLTELPKATARYFFTRFGEQNRNANAHGQSMSHLAKLVEAGLLVPMLDIRWTVLVGIVLVMGFFASQELPFVSRVILLVCGGASQIVAFAMSQRHRTTPAARDILTRFHLYLSEA